MDSGDPKQDNERCLVTGGLGDCIQIALLGHSGLALYPINLYLRICYVIMYIRMCNLNIS